MSERPANESFRTIYALLRRFAARNIRYARLTTAEKLTLLGTSIVYGALLLIFGSIAMFFITIGIAQMLTYTCHTKFAYLWVACFYLLLVILLIIFKRQLILNPICRYITRLLAPKPEE